MILDWSHVFNPDINHALPMYKILYLCQLDFMHVEDIYHVIDLSPVHNIRLVSCEICRLVSCT